MMWPTRTFAKMAMPLRNEGWDKHDDLSEVPRISLDNFYASVDKVEFSDEEAL